MNAKAGELPSTGAPHTGGSGREWCPGWRTAVLLYVVAVLLVFGDLLVSPGQVISAAGTDLWCSGYDSREFGFEQWRHGNLALWQPHLLGGAPYFAGFETGLLYLPNVLFLVLPTALAFNVSFVLHAVLGGGFMHLWLRRRRLHPAACLAGGLMFMFAAPFFLRTHAGHAAPHAVIAWIPLLFVILDALIEEASLGWTLAGGAVLSLLFYAGYPQLVFYTGIFAAVYALARLPEAPRKLGTLAGMAGMNLLAVGLWAVQLGAGLALSHECSRKGGVPYNFAASFSFPPENWLTLLSPQLFGDVSPASWAPSFLSHLVYWGRYYLWEMTPYFGVCGLPLVMLAVWRHPARRPVWIFSGCALAACLLAMGAYMPWFGFLYEFVPGFNLFRGSSKFLVLGVLFLVVLAAYGISLVAGRGAGPDDGKGDAGALLSPAWRFLCVAAAGFGGVAALLVVLAWPSLSGSVDGGGLFPFLLGLPLASREVGFDPRVFIGEDLVRKAAGFFICSLTPAILFLLWLAVLGGLGAERPAWRPRLVWVLVLLIFADLLLFGWRFRSSFTLVDKSRKDGVLAQVLKGHPTAGNRILSVSGSNSALPLKLYDMWGYGAQVVIRRYAEFLAFTQGDNPDEVTGYQTFKTLHPRFDLLRCNYLVDAKGTNLIEVPDPLPRFLLVRDWRVEEKRNNVFAAIGRPDFNPRATVFLERSPSPSWVAAAGPSPSPVPNPKSPIQTPKSPTDSIRLLRESTDWQEVEVTLSSPAVLVETDLYTPNWHAYALPGSAESSYELIPADYILRGIPLKAGTHRLRIEYRPRAFVVGKWISLASLALFAGLTVLWVVRARRRSPAPPSDAAGNPVLS